MAASAINPITVMCVVFELDSKLTFKNEENVKMRKNIMILLTIVELNSFAFASDCVRDNVNETVNCTDSGLMWQDDETAKTTKLNWQNAINHCENLSFAGNADWRLPNRNELESIVDYKRYNPAIDTAFKNVSSHFYYTSTSYVSLEFVAWVVSFSIGGGSRNHNKSNNEYVRCVRAGQ